MWLILLDERSVDEDEESEILGTIAHEIAHAWLKHDRMSPDIPEDCETKAANLAKEWGFQGRGTDPEFCSAVYTGAGMQLYHMLFQNVGALCRLNQPGQQQIIIDHATDPDQPNRAVNLTVQDLRQAISVLEHLRDNWPVMPPVFE